MGPHRKGQELNLCSKPGIEGVSLLKEAQMKKGDSYSRRQEEGRQRPADSDPSMKSLI